MHCSNASILSSTRYLDVKRVPSSCESVGRCRLHGGYGSRSPGHSSLWIEPGANFRNEANVELPSGSYWGRVKTRYPKQRGRRGEMGAGVKRSGKGWNGVPSAFVDRINVND